MRKALFVATYGGFFSSCELSNMHILQEMGYEVHGAANYEVDEHNERPQKLKDIGLVQHNIPFIRSPFSFGHFKMYKKLIKLMKIEQFDLIDTHNPIVSFLARLSAKKCKIKPVIYTAHGFFFFKGCPIINLLFFKPIELFMAKYTDALITINLEDYEAAKKMKTRGKAYYIPGIGLDVDKIRKVEVNKISKRRELGLAEEDFVIAMVGELIPRKNYPTAFKALTMCDIPNIKYLICGIGECMDEYKEMVKKLGVSDKVVFAGFRYDIMKILKSSDVFLFPTFQEGLSVALMEAMACGLPVIASQIRGNVDLVTEGQGGFLVNTKNAQEISNALKKLYICPEFRINCGKYNYNKVEEFSIDVVRNKMKKLYSNLVD